MSKLVHIILLFVAMFCLPYSYALAKNGAYQSIPALCYRDVASPDREDILSRDPYAISTKKLEEHFQLYKKLGYTPISMKQYADYIEGKASLPEKPIADNL